MRKLILKWLFGTDDVKHYIELINSNMNYMEKYIDKIDAHLQTLKENKENLDTIRKLIKICKNHGIDVDKEINQMKL